MKPFAVTLLLFGLLGLSACETAKPATYPISGQPCQPGDPVKTMDAGDCVMPGS
ncbi:hypothetical protein [Paracoccus sp. (in: a-proteobacteria)]|uniref:hypothetical protein n=1 Tax=Paracoccus sp. TaxID=267 RepID=UPI0035B28A7F